MVLKNVIRTYWDMQKGKVQNPIVCPLGDRSCALSQRDKAKQQSAKSYHVPLKRAGAAQAKKPAKFGQNGPSVPAAIS